MTSMSEAARVQEELVEAFRLGDEARVRALLSRLGQGPRQVRQVLESLLEAPDALRRQAAVFGLGELGEASSTKRLEQQLAAEEARGNRDGAAVAEVIIQALGRIKEAGARASLVTRLERLASGSPSPAEVYTAVYALWKQRHPGLLSAVRRALQKVAPPASDALQGLCVLLEKSPDELGAWAADPSVPLAHKTQVLTVLEAEIPDALLPTLSAFIFLAHSLTRQAASGEGTAGNYWECLLSVLLAHGEQVLPVLPEESRETLRAVARDLVASRDPDCSLRAAVLLRHIGRPVDAAIIEAHRPSDSIGASAFDDAARALRKGQEP